MSGNQESTAPERVTSVILSLTREEVDYLWNAYGPDSDRSCVTALGRIGERIADLLPRPVTDPTPTPGQTVTITTTLTGEQIDKLRADFKRGDDYPWLAFTNILAQQVRDAIADPVTAVYPGLIFCWADDPDQSIRRVIEVNDDDEALVLASPSSWSTYVATFQELRERAVTAPDLDEIPDEAVGF